MIIFPPTRHGAEEVRDEPEEPSRSRKPAFQGSGYRLGDTEGATSEFVQGAAVKQQRKQASCAY